MPPILPEIYLQASLAVSGPNIFCGGSLLTDRYNVHIFKRILGLSFTKPPQTVFEAIAYSSQNCTCADTC